MTHNYVMVSASLFYFLIYFLLVPKFRFIFENHMVLKKQIVNVQPAVLFYYWPTVYMVYELPFAGILPRNRYIS